MRSTMSPWISSFASLPAPLMMLLALAGCSGDKTDEGEDPIDSNPPETVDEDGDGYDSSEDCDDGDATVNPGVEEDCDGVDNDCDGDVDEGVTSTWYEDTDGDGFGNSDEEVEACEPTDGWVPTDGDCNDADPAYYPGAPEDDCTDENDYNCDGSVGYADADGDGSAACEDCDDADAARSPDAVEVCDDVDNDCDELVDDADDSIDISSMPDWYADVDADTYGDAGSTMASCDQPAGYVADDEDCDDTEDDINPAAAELCNGIDDDCDGDIDDGPADGDLYYADRDGDGYGDEDAPAELCELEDGYVDNDDDCDDTDDDINPDATEICDDEDNDCDRAIDDSDSSLDESTASTWYADDDRDTWGDATDSVVACDAPRGYIEDDNDCDDTDSAISPSATEVCNGEDDDCDSLVDDADPSLDTTSLVTWYEDGDGDGYGDYSSSRTACEAPAGYVDDATDCDDGDGGIHPDATEMCDGQDEDCDGSIDEEAADGDWYSKDEDDDGFGSADLVWACDGPDNDWDCNDANAGEPQVVDADATGTADGTLSHPWPVIQRGIDEADECVLVFAGTYEEAIDFSGKDITVTGVDGAESTIIDASSHAGPVVTFSSGETAAATLSGFTLTGGSGYLTETSDSTSCGSGETCTTYYQSWCGGGVYVDNSGPTLTDLVIDGNTLPEASSSTSGTDTTYVYSFGGGVCAQNATLSMTGVHVYSNFADQGGGVYVDEDSVVEHEASAVIANTSVEGGAYAVDGGGLVITNIASSWNESTTSAGGAIVVDGTLTATNVTFGGDDAPDAGALVVTGLGSATVMNTIFYGAATGYGVWVDSGASFSGSYNNVYLNSGGTYYGVTDPTGTLGNIAGNPRFQDVTTDGDPWNDDWSLKSTSASYNTGNPATAYNDADGSRNDMGAYGGPGGGF